MMEPNTNPVYRITNISPELAREWLKRNTRNRTLNPRKVAGFAGAMKRGEWVENGDSITFSVTDVLLNGQHRLAAVVQSGVTIRTMVVEGLPDEAQDTMDTGDKRSFGQVLAIRGVENATHIAALARMVWNWETGHVRNHNQPATHAQLSLIVEKHPEFSESVRVAAAVRRLLPVSPGVMGLCHWIFAGIDGEDAFFFFDRLRDGQGLVEGDPVFALRKTILLDAAQANRRGKIDQVLLLALTIKAWNVYRKGEKVSILKWVSGGSRPEPFPEPQ